jgi:hypothetical protein
VIIHGPSPNRDYTVIANRVLRDEELSYRARGLLCYLLSMPPDWQVSSYRLMLDAHEGRDAVRTALRELINTGYMELQKHQDNKGRYATHYIVTADPWVFDIDWPVDK